MGKWLVEQAREISIGGATLIPAAEGYGHDRKLRSVHFFELSDQPIQVTMAVSEADTKRLFTRIKDEGGDVFYVKTPIEFGMTGEL
jgi:PII-like signaling protein